MSLIYLDYNASSLRPESLKFELVSGNPSSIHRLGQLLHDKMEVARARIAQFIAASPEQIVFTSGGTESNNMVISYFAQLPNAHLISSPTEHPSILEPCAHFSQKGGAVSLVSVDQNGQVDLDSLGTLITPHTRLISIMSANNETGQYQPIEKIVEIAKDRQIPLHIDASQSLGKQDFTVKHWDADFITLSAHKAYGPTGISALYIKTPQSIESLMKGGGQEYGLRSGTPNLPGILGFEAAIEYLEQHQEAGILQLLKLKTYLRDALLGLPYAFTINGDFDNSLPNTLNIRFAGISGHKLMMNLDLAGIAVSTGSACSTGSIDPSPVLLAMGQTEAQALESIRISWGYASSTDEMDTFVRVLGGILERLYGH